jgi:S1/P1 Nuclease
MRFIGTIAAWTATLFLASPAFGWNATGHRIIAAIAYQRLTPQVRAVVDDLLRKHPDYALMARDAPSDPAGRARAVFIAAAVWADVIKGDPRFWDDTRADAKPTPPVAGFPDMKRHTNWHYYDTPYAPDGAHTEKAPSPSALTELPRLLKELATEPDLAAAYDLPWIEHLAGDVHQPLHCIGRFLKSGGSKGDAGGNLVFLAPRGNLHGLWDGAAGSDPTDAYITRFATEATAEHPEPDRIDRRPKHWIAEGAELARTRVYTFGLENGTREHPIHLPDSYLETARGVAQGQVALAGYRLAAVLNDRLKRKSMATSVATANSPYF